MNFVFQKIHRFRLLYSFLAGSVLSMAQGTFPTDVSAGCQRLLAVTGDKGKQNDVIVCGSVQNAKQHVIFFGGDVQDYIERMNLNNPLYSPWNLESTAKIILSQNPDTAVFVIKPSKMLLNTFSLYKNFLSFDEEGIPEFTKDFGALSHLHSLYKQARLKALETELGKPLVDSNQGDGSCLATGNQGEDSCIETRSGNIQEDLVFKSAIPIKLLGFSKGCVVLNQLIHELDHYKENENMKSFLSSISEIYWLDGGHIGGEGAYITDDDRLMDLKNLGCKIFVHVTPYQISDPMRKWIGEEEEIFVTKLKELNAEVVEYKHFMDTEGSIQNHFKVLTLL